MQTLIIYVFTFAIIVCAIIGIPAAIVSRWPRSRNVIAFLVACGSSYSLSFAIDMVLLAILGELPAANIIAPFFTWSGIALAAAFSAFECARSPIALGLPFIINAGIAAAAAFAHSHSIVVAFVLVLAGIGAFAARRLVPPKQASLESNPGVP